MLSIFGYKKKIWHKMENAISLYLRHATPCLDSGSERVNAILRIITNTCDISKR